MSRASRTDTPAGTPNVKFLPTRTKRADALELLAESFLQNGAATLSGGGKHQIFVHVDMETLETGCAGRCEIEHSTHVAAEHGITINPRSAVTRWNGGPMDFGMAVDSLLYRIRAAKNPPRGGSSVG